MKVDPSSWEDICEHVAEFWLKDAPKYQPGPRTINLVPFTDAINDGQPLSVNARQDATIEEVKLQLSQIFSQTPSNTIYLWPAERHACEVANMTSDQELAIEDSYYLYTPTKVAEPHSGERRAQDAFRWQNVTVVSENVPSSFSSWHRHATSHESPTPFVNPVDAGSNPRSSFDRSKWLIIHYGDGFVQPVITKKPNSYEVSHL